MPVFTSDTLPLAPSATVSWIHIGDTHMTRSGEQNEIDLGRIVDEINAIYARGGIDFVYVPGDIADDGSVVAYKAFRRHLDRLQLPWFGIVGDHDVHEERFENFQKYIEPELYSRFSIGPYRFLRLNAFSIPKPDAFLVDQRQLSWLESELRACQENHQKAVLFLHCYPSDLKQGGKELTELLRRYPVLLVDMGHTHYNELSNDGKVLYSATRSTGQVEEGPVGYSVTTLDDDVVSWHFVELGHSSLLAITYPADERLQTQRTASASVSAVPVHAKVWSASGIQSMVAQVGNVQVPLASRDGRFWVGEVDRNHITDGRQGLAVIAETEAGDALSCTVRFHSGDLPDQQFKAVDQENAIGAWPARGILGTQLGPNKNGKKW